MCIIRHTIDVGVPLTEGDKAATNQYAITVKKKIVAKLISLCNDIPFAP